MGLTHDALIESWQRSDVDAGDVERALRRLRHNLNPPIDGQPHPPVRATVLNLIVRAPDDASTDRAVDVINHLASHHPGRTLVVTTNPAALEAGLDAAVTAYCHHRPGTQALIYFEQVRLTARGAAADRAASFLAPLLIEDLPVILWWLGTPPDPAERLLHLCDRLIVDSEVVGPERLGRLTRLLETFGSSLGLTDLAWSALSSWRELLAQLFDPIEARPVQRGLHAIRLEVAPGRASVQPYLLIGWLAACLGWTLEGTSQTDGSAVRLRFQSGGSAVDAQVTTSSGSEGFRSGALVRATLRGRANGVEATFSIECEADGKARVSSQIGSAETSRLVPPAAVDEATLLGRELGRLSGDPSYPASLALATRIVP